MENLVKQTRVRFSDQQPGEFNNKTKRNLSSQIESFTGFLGDQVQTWFQWQFAPVNDDPMSQNCDSIDSEYASAVASAAFAIYSVEETEAGAKCRRRKIREELQLSRTKSQSIKREDIILSRRFSSRKDLKIGGESSSAKNLVEVDGQAGEPVNRLSRSSSVRSMNIDAIDRKHMGIQSRNKNVETKADAWERAQMEKINKRYEKLKSAVLFWENEKKLQARLKMEKKKGKLEQRMTLNQQHYHNKIARIECISERARTQAEEERRNKEFELKQKQEKREVPQEYEIS